MSFHHLSALLTRLSKVLVISTTTTTITMMMTTTTFTTTCTCTFGFTVVSVRLEYLFFIKLCYVNKCTKTERNTNSSQMLVHTTAICQLLRSGPLTLKKTKRLKCITTERHKNYIMEVHVHIISTYLE